VSLFDFSFSRFRDSTCDKFCISLTGAKTALVTAVKSKMSEVSFVTSVSSSCRTNGGALLTSMWRSDNDTN
jgi:hypothetical protein